MAGNVFAAAMIAMLAIGVTAIMAYGCRPSARQCILGVFLAIVSFLVLVILTPIHMCRRGGSDTPELLGALLSGAIFATIPHQGRKLALMLLLLISGYSLTVWALTLVHEPQYVGDRYFAEVSEGVTKSKVRTIEQLVVMRSQALGGIELEPGWLDESWKQATDENDLVSRMTIARIGDYWHSWFTQILRLDQQDAGIWCPGGTPSDFAGKLEVRPRPKPNKTELLTPAPVCVRMNNFNYNTPTANDATRQPG